MATNWIQEGETLDTTNSTGSTVSANGVLVVGDHIRVAVNDIANGASGPAYSKGVLSLAATSADDWADGARLYWNSSTGKLTDTVTSVDAGEAVGAKAALATTAYVSLGKGGGEVATQAHIADVASVTQHTLTDNGGGTADQTVASQAAPTTITDSTGLSGSHDDTLAATAAITTLTDSTGKDGTHDDTLAATAVPTTLTDSSGLDGTHGDTIAATAAIVTLTDSTGKDGTHDDTLAATTVPTTLTDSTGFSGTHDDTLAAVTAAAAITDNSGGVDPGDNTIAVVADISAACSMVTYTNVAAAAAAATQLDLSAVTGGESMSTPVQPSHPRNIKITVTDGDTSISAFVITVSGTAPDGTAITEAFNFAGGLVQTGSKVFATLTSVVVTSITGNGAGDTLDAEWGVKLGVPLPYGSTGLSITKLSVGGTIEAAAATDTTNNSFTATSAPNGTNDYEIWYEFTGPATTAIKAAVAQLAAKQNTTSTAVGVLAQDVSDVGQKVMEHNTLLGVVTQNASDTAQKIIELVTREAVTAQNVANVTEKIIEHNTLLGVLAQNGSDVGQKVIELVTREAVTAQNVSDLGQKIIELVTLAGVAQANLKEITTELAAIRVDNAAQVTKINAVIAVLESAGITLSA